MKKLLFAISAFALLTGLSTSCQKDIDPLQESNQNTEFTVTATIADNDTKVSYEEDGTTYALKPSWQVNDIIIGFDDATSTNTYGFKVTAVDDGKATLAIITSGDYVGSKITNPDNGTNMYMFYAPGKKPSDISEKSLTVSLASQSKDVVPALMMASATVSGGSLSLAFTNKTAIIAIKNPTMATASTAYTSIALSGTGINTEVVFNLDGNNLQASYKTAGTITKTVEFTSDATTKKGAEITYIVACPLSTAADLTFTASNGEKFSKASKTMSAGEYYYMTPTFASGIPEGALNGVFTVGKGPDNTAGTADDVKVRFSKGNLQYQASTGKWQFAANQYDYIGDAAGNNTATGRDTQSAWIDLFGWGATGQNSHGQQPYSISKENSDYKTVATAASGETLTIENKADWGYCMGGATSVWRTLSGGNSGEWKYLFNEREGASNKVGFATVGGTQNDGSDGVHGIIILPDTFTDPMKNGGSKAFDSKTINWTTNVYTSGDNWNAMEEAGAVFLPVAGIRNGPDVSNVDGPAVQGQYWSSTAGEDYEACDLYFGCNFGINYFVNPGMTDDRNNGCSVRLVRDANQ